MQRFILHINTGPQQGVKFALPDGCPTVIGRDEDADLSIPDHSVSRKHAVITAKNDELILVDCSSNGTFVNGEPVKYAVLKPYDNICIGYSSVKVMLAHDQELVTSRTPALQAVAAGSQRPAIAPPIALALADIPESFSQPEPAPAHLRGSLTDIALLDLIQLLSSSRKSGVLVLRGAQGVGRIDFDQGQICHASIAEIDSPRPDRVFYRLMRWTEGTFDFESPDGRTYDRPITGSNDFLLLEAMRQLDEINNLGGDLPPLHAEVYLASPLPAPLRELSSGDLDFIQVVLHHVTVSSILDHSGDADFQGYMYLKSLLGRKFLVVGSN